MTKIDRWIGSHPDIWEFVLFNLLSNCATLTNFITLWLCNNFVFSNFRDQPFRLFIFSYTNVEHDLGLCGFLSFLTATALAQTINFFVQKNFVFCSDARFSKAVPKYILLAIVLVAISAALPSYSQALFLTWGLPQSLAPTLANFVNIIVQVVVSYPAMKFWIMPKTEKS